MEVFEVHITGDEKIHEVAKQNNCKTIAIDLLRPNNDTLRTEHMTSMIFKFDSYQSCKSHVDALVEAFKIAGVNVLRVKIESPYYDHYRKQSLYMESHFEAEDARYPMSRNQRKTTRLATDREYDQRFYDLFRAAWASKELELCLYDTWVDEDKDWFDLYPGGK